MNKPIGECSFVLTKKLFYESMQCVQKDSMDRTLKRAIILLVLIWLGTSVYTLVKGGGLAYAATELFVMLALIVLVTVWIPRRRAKAAWNAMEMSGKADGERSVRFYEDRLEVECIGEITEADYEDVKKALFTDNLLILVCEDKKGIIIEKNGISGINEEKLLEMIKENGGLQA